MNIYGNNINEIAELMGEYHFLEWRLNTDTQSLQNKDGQSLVLQERAFQLLLYLIENQSSVISKEELIEKLWPDRVVTENSLNQLIAELRKALGDDAKVPRFIKTIPKKGFTFIPEVSKAHDLKRQTPKQPSFVIGVFIVLLFSIFWMMVSSLETSEKLVAPDGSAVAYFSNDGNDVYLNIEFHDEFKAPIVTRITKPSNKVMAWSTDSKRVVYNATQDEQPYISLNVLDLVTGQTSYFKSPKKDGINLEEALPDTFDKPAESTKHEVAHYQERSVATINYSDSESFTVLFENGRVVSIQWQPE